MPTTGTNLIDLPRCWPRVRHMASHWWPTISTSGMPARASGRVPPFQSSKAIQRLPNRHSSPGAILCGLRLWHAQAGHPHRLHSTSCARVSRNRQIVRGLHVSDGFFRRQRRGLPDRPATLKLDPVVRHDLASVDTDRRRRLALRLPVCARGLCRPAAHIGTPRSAVGRPAGCPHASVRTVGPSHRAQPHAQLRRRDASNPDRGRPAIHPSGRHRYRGCCGALAADALASDQLLLPQWRR